MSCAHRLPVRAALFAAALLACTSLSAQSYQSVVPTTTFAAETTNNTAAATVFPGCEVTTVTNGQCVDNGNMKPKNVSKVDIHTLLASSQQGAKVYTTYIPYWGSSKHPNVGYSSDTKKQVAREVAAVHRRDVRRLQNSEIG